MDPDAADAQLHDVRDGTTGLPVEKRTVSEYDDIREESSSYSHGFAETDPYDEGPGFVDYRPGGQQDG